MGFTLLFLCSRSSFELQKKGMPKTMELLK